MRPAIEVRDRHSSADLARTLTDEVAQATPHFEPNENAAEAEIEAVAPSLLAVCRRLARPGHWHRVDGAPRTGNCLDRGPRLPYIGVSLSRCRPHPRWPSSNVRHLSPPRRVVRRLCGDSLRRMSV
jgi:hypothetical protein